MKFLDGLKSKKLRKKWIAGGILIIAAVVVGIFTVSQLSGKKASADTLPIIEASVEKGTISSSTEGTGTLANGDAEDVNIPTGVEIEEVKVKSGDSVKAGDVLATVDSVSLRAELETVQESIADLDSQINEETSNSNTQTVKSAVSGRVKKIFVAEGDAVSASMLEHGAVMLISLDGKMKVNFDTAQAATVGEDVNVTITDGSVVTGTVTKVSGTSCTVTVTDNGTGYQENVSVSDTSGNVLGEGTLLINQELKVTEIAGTVNDINVSENEKVSVDTSLLTLNGEFASSTYYSLINSRKNLEEKLALLLEISEGNTVIAKTDGTITAVNVSTGTVSQSSSSSETSIAENTSSSDSSSGGMTNMSYQSAPATGFMKLSALKATEISPTVEPEETQEPQDPIIEEKTAITGIDQLTIAVPVTGQKPATSISETDFYTAKISWSPTGTAFKESTVYKAAIILTAKEGYYFPLGTAPSVSGAVVSGVSISSESEGNSISFIATFPKTGKIVKNEKDTKSNNDSSKTDNSTNDNSAQPPTTTQQQNSLSGSNVAGGSSTGGGSNISAASGSSGGSISTDSATQTSSSSSAEDVNTELVTAFSIASNETLIVSVNVDELDINSVSLGKKATLTLDAIPDKEFEGKITDINQMGSASNGVTKYAVELTVSKTEAMLLGMNVSASIITEEKADILLVPSVAVQERGTQTFVYTQKDESTGELSGEVEVETGTTDGSRIEIVSGLANGDTIYYQMPQASTDSQNIMQFQGGDMNGNAMIRDGSAGTSGERPQGSPMGGAMQ